MVNVTSLWQATVSMWERAVPWTQEYVSCRTGCRSARSLRLKAYKNIR